MRPESASVGSMHGGPRVASRAHRSFDRDPRRRGLNLAVVVGPLELQRPALGRHREEGDERVRRDGLMQVGAEDFGAVVRAHEQIDDVARDRDATFVAPISGFHDMRDQRLDLDDLAALCFGWNVDECAGHGQLYSRQAAMVTITSTVSDHSEPSLNSAMATTFCESARRMRVEKAALPARGPRCTEMISGCGFFSLKTWIALT